jgi:hypothetical protein
LSLFLHIETPQQEVLKVADQCRTFLDKGVTPSSIGILSGRRRAAGFNWTEALVAAVESRKSPIFWATQPNNYGTRDHMGEDPSRVVLSRIHSAKGREFSHVLIPR